MKYYHVKNPWVRLSAADISIMYFTPDVVPFPDIERDSFSISTSYLYVDVGDDFDGYLDFNYEVIVDGISYWDIDSLTDVAVGVSEILSNIPKQFSIHQNYPNPFNPSTVIQYSIAKQSYVSVKVYDVLGRAVTILVNREQPAGYYKVEFDASHLTSGIYFYRMQAGDFIETKKMVLIK